MKIYTLRPDTFTLNFNLSVSKRNCYDHIAGIILLHSFSARRREQYQQRNEFTSGAQVGAEPEDWWSRGSFLRTFGPTGK